MKYLLDTCVISELIRPQPDQNVVTWMQEQDENDLYLSALTFGEIEKGIKKSKNLRKKKSLQLWVENDLKKRFEGRIISIDLDVSIKWGAIQGKAELIGKSIPAIDGLIAVSGLTHNCVVVTRNTADMVESSVELLNPWLTKV